MGLAEAGRLGSSPRSLQQAGYLRAGHDPGAALMPRLRPKRPTHEPPQPYAAICMEEFRAGAVAPLIARGQQLPLDHPVVHAHPGYFRGLVRLEGVNYDGR
jgi:hypothetical protein